MENLLTLRNSNLDGAFATAHMTLCGGTFLVGFVKLLGGSDLWIGALTAIPSLMGLLQIPGSIWGRGYNGYKRFVTPGGFLFRLFYVPFLLLPLLAFSADVKLAIMTISVMAASAAVALVGPIYNDWLAEMVPDTSRGWFFSRRNAIMAGVGTGVGLAGALLLDYFRKINSETTGFTVVFGLGIACAALSMVYYLQMTDIARPNPVQQSLQEGIRAFRMPLQNKRFRTVLFFFVAFVFAQAFPGNLFGAYALESLHLPFTVIQICAASQALGSIIFGPFWGYMADKYGNRPLLLFLGMGIALTPVCWMFTRPDQIVWNTVILVIGHIYSGLVWGGVSVCQYNLLLATADEKDRAPYLGVGLAFQALTGGIAPLVGAQVMAMVRTGLGPWEGYHVIFWATLGLRFLATFLLIPVKETGSASIRDTFRRLKSMSPTGYAALRSLSKSDNPHDRGQAIETVASKGFSLATEEIIAALHDPSPMVRRRAADALAKLGEPMAVEALIHQLHEHPDLVEDETIEAIGDLGTEEGVHALIDLLKSPRASHRRAAAKALGRIGSPEAVEPLIAAAGDQGDADLRRASLQALRVIGSKDASHVFVTALLDHYPSVRIAAAEGVSDLHLPEARDHLRASLMRFNDEAESEVAYALGAVGIVDDIPLILEEAKKCVSITTRRRALLGVARLLGVEREVYPLFMSEGLSQDSALQELLRPALKKHPRVRLAFQKFSSGEAQTALHLLTQSRLDPTFAMLESDVQELFLVAGAYAAKLVREGK